MKKIIFLASLLLSRVGLAEAPKFTPEQIQYLQKMKVAQALGVLHENQVVTSDISRCVRMDEDLIKMLEKNKDLKSQDSKVHVVCPDSE